MGRSDGVTYGVLLKPLPWPDSDRLVRLTETRQGHEPRVRGTMSNGPYRQRAREIGVRTALGARPSDVVRLVLRHVMLVAAAGIACGLWTAYALSRLLGTVLYGVNPHDLASFAAVGIALAVVAAVASVVPARRAARLDPWQVLR